MKNLLSVVLFLIALCLPLRQAGVMRYALCEVPLQESNKLSVLAKQVTDAKTIQEAYLSLEGLKVLYFENNQYNEFADFLKSLENKNQEIAAAINYYLGLTRYRQLKYLEQAQEWNEYFNKGDFYRGQLSGSLEKAISGTPAGDVINIYSRLILWQYYKDRDDPSSDTLLSGLTESVLEYSNTDRDISVIKAVADTFLPYKEKAKAKQLYAIYVRKLLALEIKDNQLKEAAFGFYQEGKLELSENLYDAYIERMLLDSKPKAISALKDIAAQFVYQDDKPNDPAYAENIFRKIEEIGSAAAFDQELIYMRAFNLEKMKDFSGAKELYLELAGRAPEGSHFDEAVFKAGVISTYLLGEIDSGRTLFEGLIQKESSLSPQAISSFYQLGLLSQWEGDLTRAGAYYAKLIDQAKENFSETVMLAQKRLREIEAQEPIEYNLKMFLEAALKKDPSAELMHNAELLCRPYKARQGEEVIVESNLFTPQTGCIPVNFNYLWSGHSGETELSGKNPSLNTSYKSTGTKEITLVIVSPAGIVDYCLDFIDVY
ncbi:MAG: hypothetical protein QME65_00350 [Candidatus Omnitrophota bacterium]|nr:hypothetical protein [Candidatus Omnitrophota bacterium]